MNTAAQLAVPRRWLRRTAWAVAALLLALLLALAGLGYYLLRTESGLRFVLAQARSWTDNALQVDNASGQLLGEFELRGLRYTDATGTEVTLERLHLRLKPAALLQRLLHVEQLDLEQLSVTPGAAPASSTAATKPTVLPVRLPIDVAIDALTLRGFVLHGADDTAPPFTLAAADFAGSWRGDRITITHLATALKEAGPLQLTAQAQLFPDHIDLQQLQLQGPGQVDASGRVGVDPFASDFTLRWQALHWPLVVTESKPADVTDGAGTLHLSGVPDAYQFDLNSTAQVQGHGALLTAHGSGGLQMLQLDALQLIALASTTSGKITAAPAAVSASGTIAWAPRIQAQLTAFLAHVNPALFGAGIAGDINGKLETRSTLDAQDQPQIAFSAALARSTLRGQAFALSAEGNTDLRRANLKNLLLQAGGGRVQAHGAVAWLPHLAPDIDAQISKLNPALFAKDWPGDLNGSLSAHGGGAGGAPIRFTADIDHSKLRGYPLKFTTEATLAGETVAVQQLRLSSGATTLNASGQASPPFDLSGKLDSPDLAALLPALSGRAAFDFQLTGTVAQPHVISHGTASGLQYEKQKVGRLSWTADVDPNADSKLTVALRDADFGYVIRSIDLDVTGLEVYHHADLRLDSEQGKASIALQGGYDRKRGEWGGELQALSLAPDGSAAWSLNKGAGILLGASRRALEPACLHSEIGQVCFNLEQNVLQDGTRIGWNIEHLLLNAFQPLLPPHYIVGGSATGEGHVNFTGGDIVEAQGGIDFQGIRLETPDAPPLILQSGFVRADQKDNRLHATAGFKAEQGSVDADAIATPAGRFQDRPLSGQVKVDVPSIAFLQSLLPALRNLDGRIGGALTLAGTVGKPSLGGELALSGGKAKLVVAGITINDVQFKLHGDGNGPLALNGTLSSGGGAVVLDGRIDPFATPLRADVTLKGSDFQAINTREARAWVSPDLHLLRDEKGVTLLGELQVPRADITPKGLGGGGVEVSPDQVLIGVEAKPKEAPLAVTVDLRLTLGNAVRFEGFGLKTRIEGAVTVDQQPQRDPLASGELRLVDGRYKAYGQDLKLETGRLIFSGGPVTTPAVDLFATRHPRDDITVGVRVRGTLAKPELTLQSSPTLPREQQLSWLVLGRSLETSSTQDRSLVSSAALSLGLGGGDFLAGLLGKRVGLDQLSVGGANVGGSEVAASAQSISGAQATANTTAATAQAAQVTLGKYLTPKLFVSYGISLFQRGYSFRMLYTLGHGFKLSSESGTASGGDIIYTVDGGKKPPAEPTPAAAPK